MTTQIATPEELYEREGRSEALRGYKPTPQVEALEEIFTSAVDHDSACQLSNYKAYRDIRHDGQTDDANVNTSRYDVIALCAAIAPAALRRVPAIDMLASGLADVLCAPDEDDLEKFLRPIFEESGIGNRYVVDWAATRKARGDV